MKKKPRKLRWPERKIVWNRRGWTIPSTCIGVWKILDRKRAERAVRESIEATNGRVFEACLLVGCGWRKFYYLLHEFGMGSLPREIRQRMAARFRLPPAA